MLVTSSRLRRLNRVERMSGGLVPLGEEFILSAMHPRLAGTLPQHTGIPARCPREDRFWAGKIGLKPWSRGASCQYPSFITYLQGPLESDALPLASRPGLAARAG